MSNQATVAKQPPDLTMIERGLVLDTRGCVKEMVGQVISAIHLVQKELGEEHIDREAARDVLFLAVDRLMDGEADVSRFLAPLLGKQDEETQ